MIKLCDLFVEKPLIVARWKQFLFYFFLSALIFRLKRLLGGLNLEQFKLHNLPHKFTNVIKCIGWEELLLDNGKQSAYGLFLNLFPRTFVTVLYRKVKIWIENCSILCFKRQFPKHLGKLSQTWCLLAKKTLVCIKNPSQSFPSPIHHSIQVQNFKYVLLLCLFTSPIIHEKKRIFTLCSFPYRHLQNT